MKAAEKNPYSSPYSIIRLREGDLTVLRRMIHLFGEVFEEPETYLSEKTSSAYLEGLLRKPHILFMAAMYENLIIGGLAAYVLDKFEQERSEIYIYDLAVHPDHRRKGIASALIRRLQAEAVSFNAWVIYVQADRTDEPAVLLYESMGVREDVLHFDIPVRQEKQLQ